MTEKAGKAESLTTFDEEFESLCVQVDQIKVMTERMLSQMVVMIQPNPSKSEWVCPPLVAIGTPC